MILELTQGKSVVVSPQDVDDLLRYSWHAVRCGSRGKWYARRGEKVAGAKSPRAVYMHRHIMQGELDDGLVVDHINGDGLDNRRENLRVVTNAANGRNKQTYGGVSGLRGVYPQANGFLARIGTAYLGYFSDAMEAAFAVNQHLDKLDGAVGIRNPIDYAALLKLLEARRAVITAQIQAVDRAAKC